MGWLSSYPEQAAMWQKYVSYKGAVAAVPGNKSHEGFAAIDTIYPEPWHFSYDLPKQELIEVEDEPISAEEYMKGLM